MIIYPPDADICWFLFQYRTPGSPGVPFLAAIFAQLPDTELVEVSSSGNRSVTIYLYTYTDRLGTPLFVALVGNTLTNLVHQPHKMRQRLFCRSKAADYPTIFQANPRQIKKRLSQKACQPVPITIGIIEDY